MSLFELRRSGDGYDLSGGQLEEILHYPEPDAVEYAKRVVGFLAQVSGAELRVYNGDNLIETKTYLEGVRPNKGELGNP